MTRLDSAVTALRQVLEGIADGRFAVAGPVVAGLEVALDAALDAHAAVSCGAVERRS